EPSTTSPLATMLSTGSSLRAIIAPAALAFVLALAAAPAAALQAGSGMTLVSYNIHAGKDADQQPNLARVSAVLDTLGADIVLLQEVDRGTRRSGGEDQVAELERLTGM